MAGGCSHVKPEHTSTETPAGQFGWGSLLCGHARRGHRRAATGVCGALTAREDAGGLEGRPGASAGLWRAHPLGAAEHARIVGWEGCPAAVVR